MKLSSLMKKEIGPSFFKMEEIDTREDKFGYGFTIKVRTGNVFTGEKCAQSVQLEEHSTQRYGDSDKIKAIWYPEAKVLFHCNEQWGVNIEMQEFCKIIPPEIIAVRVDGEPGCWTRGLERMDKATRKHPEEKEIIRRLNAAGFTFPGEKVYNAPWSGPTWAAAYGE